MKCKRCEGEGTIDEVFRIGEDEYGDGEKTCPDCEGCGISDCKICKVLGEKK